MVNALQPRLETGRRADVIPAYEKAERLLEYLVQKSIYAGDKIAIGREGHEASSGQWMPDPSPTIDAALSHVGIESEKELWFLLRHLARKEWIEAEGFYRPFSCSVTVTGFRHVDDRAVNTDTSQAFIAMWFHESMDEVFNEGLEPAVREAGFLPVRIDRVEHINKIDDEIIAEIRRSRFLVADFTHGCSGVRGGVYYEAGFARGMRIPVFYTCRFDMVDHLHFDTRQFSHVVWRNAADLREKLRNRIVAVLGEGPTKSERHRE